MNSIVLDDMLPLSRATGHGTVFGFAGYSGSGKTTIVEKLIRYFNQKKIETALVKHAHHQFEADHKGKDSHRLRVAGSRQVLISSSKRSAHSVANENKREPSLESLLLRLEPTRLVLVEGFKKEFIPKLKVWQDTTKHLCYTHKIKLYWR